MEGVVTTFEFQNLDPELQWLAMLELDWNSLSNLCQASRTLREVCQVELFWKAKIQRDFPEYDYEKFEKGIYSPKKVYYSMMNNALYKAVRYGNVEEVEHWISWGASIHDHPIPLLNIAIRFQQYSLVPFLLEKGVNVNRMDDKTPTALMLAARSGNLDLVRLLVENGADINVVVEGNTARSQAITPEIDEYLESLGGVYGSKTLSMDLRRRLYKPWFK
jgi:hypothetical protein